MDKERFPPLLLDIKRVIPIGQAQQHGDIIVTALAFEVYEYGSIATFLVNSAPNVQYASERFGRVAFTVELRDADGNQLIYANTRCYYGTGDSYGYRGRAICGLYWKPRLDGQQAQIVIPELRWTHSELNPDAVYEQPITNETIPGPWIFPIILEP